MYRYGDGVSQDYKQAMDWSMKAASTGNGKGQYTIGLLYYCGFGVPQDYQQAMDWFLKAVNNGNTDAMNQIGVMHQSGIYVTKSIPTAIEWYTKAANQGNAIAQHNLGWVYKNHDEVKDLQKAVNLCQKAADSDKGYAKYDVEELNRQGYYAKEDEQEGNID
jgi:TPR repeat protein